MMLDQPLTSSRTFRVEIPWLVIEVTDNPAIRLDVRILDRLEASGKDLILEVEGVVEDVEVDLEVESGARTAEDIVDRLAPYTRRASITRLDVYEDARSRLQTLTGALRCRDQPPPVPAHALFVGPHPVFSRGERLHVGELLAFDLSEVREYAIAGEVLPLPHGARLQAALAVLVVPLDKRTLEKELDLLAERIAAYEAGVR